MSINIQWNEATADSWNEAARRAPSIALQQDWAYGEAVLSLGGDILRATIWDGETCIGLAQFTIRRILKRFPIALAMRGPVWLTPLTNKQKAAAYRALKQTCPLPRLRLLLWMPESDDHVALRTNRHHKAMSSYSTITLDLTQSEDDLLKAMDGKWRNRLRAAQQTDLRPTPVGLDAQQYLWLLEKEDQQRQQIGYVAPTAALVPIYQQWGGKRSLYAIRAQHQQDTVAGMLWLIHGHCATYHIGWSDETGKKLGAHNLLMWESLKALKQRHIHTADLGGINTEDGAGIARFKLGTGGALHSLCGTYW